MLPKRRVLGTLTSICVPNSSTRIGLAAYLAQQSATGSRKEVSISSSGGNVARVGNSSPVCDARIQVLKELSDAPSRLWWNISGITSRLMMTSPVIPLYASPSTTELRRTWQTFLVILISRFGLQRIRSEKRARQANARPSSRLEAGQ